MLGSEDPRYGFAIGRVRAREARLLTRSRFDRLAQLGSEEELLGGLADTPYAELSGEGLTGRLAAARRENREFFLRYCLDGWAVEGLKLRWDLYNLKLFIKARFGGVDPKPLFSPEGRFSIDLVERAVSGEGVVDQPLQLGLERALTAYYEVKNPAYIDFELDGYWFKLIWALAHENPWFRQYLRLCADLSNLETLVRFKFLEEPGSELPRALLPYGSLPKEIFLQIYSEPWDGVLGRLRLTPYHRWLADGVEYLREKGSFVRLERLITETKLSFLKRARYFTFGVEPLISYYLFKEAEIRNLSLIGFGIAQGVDIQELRERIAWVD